MGCYAVIENNSLIVTNTILSDDGFEIDGCYLVGYDHDKIFCQKGMCYNSNDGVFYDDDAFTLINGVSVS